MIKFPVDGPTMKLKELKEEPPLAPGKKRKIAQSREVFFETWKKMKGDGAFWRSGKSSGVFFWRMMPWWVFSHALQLPRKYCQFLPPLIIEHLLRFLDDPTGGVAFGYKLMLLGALSAICDKMSSALYLFSVSNEGTQPCILGAQSLILRKLQTISPRARVAVSAAEVQTLFAKTENFTAALSMPGQAKVLLEAASLPAGFFMLYQLFGVAAIGASIGVGAGLLALTAKIGNLKTKTEQELRSQRKKQEAVLNELASDH